jgi:putative heme-binding domain-containing protein
MTRFFPHGCGAWIYRLFLFVVVLLPVCPTTAQEAKWIWSSDQTAGKIPTGACYFRKTFTLSAAPDSAVLSIAADDAYELHVNGRSIASGGGYRRLTDHDLAKHLNRGRNVIAIRVVNSQGNTAGLAARVQMKAGRGEWQSFSSDDSWKTSLSPYPLWDTMIYNDSRWSAAKVYGKLGETAPWDRLEHVAVEETHKNERFQIAEEFTVERIMNDQQTGSLIAMTFNEFGHIIAAKEGGPLLLLYDSNRDQVVDKTRVYCDKVKNCQGILALNGDVFVTADGPQGAGLYRLSDKNRDGSLEEVKLLVKFTGEMGEHGPHAVTLGPDGLIYTVIGNLTAVDREIDASSPYRNYYEGDLVPRYEDPGGHAVGVKAPGGAVLRTDTDGTVVQIFAGGLRNVYDIVFDRSGDLFAHDSDMETDEGTPWFRNTQLFHVTSGSDIGWRSGWSRWPEYYPDTVPAALDTGRGSPTGGAVYQHFAFPARYQNSLFLADWTRGRILAVKLKPNGSSYTASSEVFLEGQPLNVTDLDVGPDGALYFVTGGRGTDGGLYRVVWRGKIPPEVSDLGEGISAAIRQPQPNSAWARQRIAKTKQQLGDNWDRLVEGVVRSASNPPEYRLRALELMQLFGPAPSSKLLGDLARDKNELVRGKVADLMGIHAADDATEKLLGLLNDPNLMVRRRACESLARSETAVPFTKLRACLATNDAHLGTAARRLLERQPVESYLEEVLGSDEQRVLIHGGLALMIAQPSAEHARRIVSRVSEVSQQFVSDENFVDLLRLLQVAIQRGELAPTELEDLAGWLKEEFPGGASAMNRELIRLLAYLGVSDITDRYVDYLKSKADPADKLHVALYLRYIHQGWSRDQKWAYIDFLEQSARAESAGNLPIYVRNVTRDFARSLDDEESRYALTRALRWPNAALGGIFRLPQQLDEATLEQLREVDRKLAERNEESAKPLLVGLVAVMARSGDPASMAYLREVWRRDPERRPAAAIGLSQQPDGENWDYLVRSLAILEGKAAQEVIGKLLSVPDAPEAPEYYRQVILRGLELKDQGGEQAVALLNHWGEEQVAAPDESWDKALAAWQSWFRKKYPDQPEAVLPEPNEENTWNFDELLEYLTVGDGLRKGSATEGAAVFAKAQCIKCHVYQGRGERIGPDLTTIGRRFMRKEILESILFPSHVISDQYASRIVTTNTGKSYTGIVAAGAQGERVVLQSNGEKVAIREIDIDEIQPSRKSSMPAGLLNNLSQEEIANLFAYLMTSSRDSLATAAGTSRRPIGEAPRKK